MRRAAEKRGRGRRQRRDKRRIIIITARLGSDRLQSGGGGCGGELAAPQSPHRERHATLSLDSPATAKTVSMEMQPQTPQQPLSVNLKLATRDDDDDERRRGRRRLSLA